MPLDFDTLCARGFIIAVRPLFSESSAALRTASLARKLQQLEAKVLARYTARQQYFKEILETAQVAKREGRAPPNISNVHLERVLMQRHSGRFIRLPPHWLSELQSRAVAGVEEAQRARAEDLEHARAELQLHLERLAVEGRQRHPNMRLSSTQICPSSLIALEAWFCFRSCQPGRLRL